MHFKYEICRKTSIREKKEIQSASDLHLSEYLSYLQFVVNFDYYEFNWVRLGAYGSKVVFPLATCRLTSHHVWQLATHVSCIWNSV